MALSCRGKIYGEEAHLQRAGPGCRQLCRRPGRTGLAAGQPRGPAPAQLPPVCNCFLRHPAGRLHCHPLQPALRGKRTRPPAERFRRRSDHHPEPLLSPGQQDQGKNRIKRDNCDQYQGLPARIFENAIYPGERKKGRRSGQAGIRSPQAA